MSIDRYLSNLSSGSSYFFKLKHSKSFLNWNKFLRRLYFIIWKNLQYVKKNDLDLNKLFLLAKLLWLSQINMFLNWTDYFKKEFVLFKFVIFFKSSFFRGVKKLLFIEYYPTHFNAWELEHSNKKFHGSSRKIIEEQKKSALNRIRTGVSTFYETLWEPRFESGRRQIFSRSSIIFLEEPNIFNSNDLNPRC